MAVEQPSQVHVEELQPVPEQVPQVQVPGQVPERVQLVQELEPEPERAVRQKQLQALARATEAPPPAT